VQIRFASLADVPQIVAMEPQAEFAPHWSVEQYEGLFLPNAPKRQVLVAADNATVQGFLVALCPCDEWEIESVVVEPAMRRKGRGEALLREAASRAAAGGAVALVL
jgi:ribosomal protein S18 acetylase RimI-like enzyme